MFKSLLSSDSEFHLQVVEKTSLLCSEPEEETLLTLEVAKGGKIPCPGLSCYSTDVLWYKVRYTHEQDFLFHNV